MTTWHELQNDFIEDLSSPKNKTANWYYMENIRIPFLVRSWVPKYEYTLLALILDHPQFGYVDDLSLINPEGKVDVYKMIRASIHEALSEIAYKWLAKNRPQKAA